MRIPFRGARLRETTVDEDASASASRYAAEARRLTAEIARHAHAVTQIAPSGWFLSHVAAAVLWGLPVPLRVLRTVFSATRNGRNVMPPRGIDVAVLSPRRASKAVGVRGHELSPRLAKVRAHDGLRLTSPATTWALLANLLTVDELIAMGDAIVRIPRRRGMERGTEADALATIAQLRAAADAPYRRESDKLREALKDIRVGSASVAETRIRCDSIRAGLPEPELDFDVFAADGAPIGFTEIAYPDFHLLVEYEGDHHRTDRDQWHRDIDKHTACVEAGWQVLRLASRHVYPSTESAIERIRSALLREGWRP